MIEEEQTKYKEQIETLDLELKDFNDMNEKYGQVRATTTTFPPTVVKLLLLFLLLRLLLQLLLLLL